MRKKHLGKVGSEPGERLPASNYFEAPGDPEGRTQGGKDVLFHPGQEGCASPEPPSIRMMAMDKAATYQLQPRRMDGSGGKK